MENALSKNTVDDAVKVKSIVSNLNNAKLIVITSDFHLKRVQLIFNIILENYDMEFVGVESNLEEEKLNSFVQHEQKAIKAILEDGLYY